MEREQSTPHAAHRTSEEQQEHGSGRMEDLRKEADRARQMAREQLAELRQRVDARALALGGAVVGLSLAARLFSRSDEDDDELQYVSRRHLDAGYVDGLAGSVQRYLRDGLNFTEALGTALRNRAPVLLQEPPAPEPSRSSSGWWKGALLLATVGAGVYAAQKMLGQNPASWIQQRMGASSEPGDEARRSYSTVQGTAGARMPAPERSGTAATAAQDTHRGETPSIVQHYPAPPAEPSSSDRPGSGPSTPLQQTPTVKHTEGGRMPDPDRQEDAEKPDPGAS